MVEVSVIERVKNMSVQVRNLTSCMKVAVDFLSPHNMGLCMHMAQEIRADQDRGADLRDWYSAEPEHAHAKEDTLQTEKILVHAALALLEQRAAASRGRG